MSDITTTKKIFNSDNPSLSFNERMKLASVEKANAQKERDIKKRAEAEDIY